MKKHHWFDFVEYFSLIGLGAGSVLSVVSQQALLTSAPLSFALVVGFANRRRVEQAQEQKLIDSLSMLDQKLTKSVKLIDQQVQTLPTPEMIGDVRQSILRHGRGEIKRLSAQIGEVRAEVEERLQVFDQEALNATRQDISQLRQQYTEVYNSLTEISAALEHAATTHRVEEVGEAVASLNQQSEQLQATLHTLDDHNKHSLASLQDQMNQISRQVKSLPPPVDAAPLKRDLSELVRVVADLVPKRDFSNVVTDLRSMQEWQQTRTQSDEGLRQDLQTVRQRLQALPDVPQLRSQLEESFTHEIRSINHQLRTLHNSPSMQARIEEVLKGELTTVYQQMSAQLSSSPYDLVFDLSASHPFGEEYKAIAGSRLVLEEALEKSQNRVILIWPWSNYTTLDHSLLTQMEGYLRQKKMLEVGWCHLSDRQSDRFLSKINRRWAINPLSDGELQGTLKRLLALKRRYPDYFRFKILGMVENFLISDTTFAVLGIQDRLKTQTVLQDVDLKLRTTDEQVIQQLTQRFDQENPPAEETEAYWNRAITRYDLGDKAGAIQDLNSILAVAPDEAVVYNLRGIIRYDQQDITGAIEDLNQSIRLWPDQSSAYCNRGYIQTEHGDPAAAIADFDAALDIAPDSAIAYFYRGIAYQKLEQFDAALRDYSAALDHTPNQATTYFDRGQLYRDLGCYTEAIADFESAVHLFTEKGQAKNAQTISQALIELNNLAATQPSTPPPPFPPMLHPAPVVDATEVESLPLDESEESQYTEAADDSNVDDGAFTLPDESVPATEEISDLTLDESEESQHTEVADDSNVDDGAFTLPTVDESIPATEEISDSREISDLTEVEPDAEDEDNPFDSLFSRDENDDVEDGVFEPSNVESFDLTDTDQDADRDADHTDSYDSEAENLDDSSAFFEDESPLDDDSANPEHLETFPETFTDSEIQPGAEADDSVGASDFFSREEEQAEIEPAGFETFTSVDDDVENADLAEANLTEADLAEADRRQDDSFAAFDGEFENADLADADLADADLVDASLADAERVQDDSFAAFDGEFEDADLANAGEFFEDESLREDGEATPENTFLETVADEEPETTFDSLTLFSEGVLEGDRPDDTAEEEPREEGIPALDWVDEFTDDDLDDELDSDVTRRPDSDDDEADDRWATTTQQPNDFVTPEEPEQPTRSVVFDLGQNVSSFEDTAIFSRDDIERDRASFDNRGEEDREEDDRRATDTLQQNNVVISSEPELPEQSMVFDLGQNVSSFEDTAILERFDVDTQPSFNEATSEASSSETESSEAGSNAVVEEGESDATADDVLANTVEDEVPNWSNDPTVIMEPMPEPSSEFMTTDDLLGIFEEPDQEEEFGEPLTEQPEAWGDDSALDDDLLGVLHEEESTEETAEEFGEPLTEQPGAWGDDSASDDDLLGVFREEESTEETAEEFGEPLPEQPEAWGMDAPTDDDFLGVFREEESTEDPTEDPVLLSPVEEPVDANEVDTSEIDQSSTIAPAPQVRLEQPSSVDDIDNGDTIDSIFWPDEDDVLAPELQSQAEAIGEEFEASDPGQSEEPDIEASDDDLFAPFDGVDDAEGLDEPRDELAAIALDSATLDDLGPALEESTSQNESQNAEDSAMENEVNANPEEGEDFTFAAWFSDEEEPSESSVEPTLEQEEPSLDDAFGAASHADDLADESATEEPESEEPESEETESEETESEETEAEEPEADDINSWFTAFEDDAPVSLINDFGNTDSLPPESSSVSSTDSVSAASLTPDLLSREFDVSQPSAAESAAESTAESSAESGDAGRRSTNSADQGSQNLPARGEESAVARRRRRETDTQQIGTQTLSDFMTVIRSDADGQAGEGWAIAPRSEPQSTPTRANRGLPNEPETVRTGYALSNHSGAASSQGEPESPQMLDDLFLDFPERDEVN
ncbi:MAG: tetratricopeptide repeat protein [Elainellaceae cyanobacterium]